MTEMLGDAIVVLNSLFSLWELIFNAIAVFELIKSCSMAVVVDPEGSWRNTGSYNVRPTPPRLMVVATAAGGS